MRTTPNLPAASSSAVSQPSGNSLGRSSGQLSRPDSVLSPLHFQPGQRTSAAQAISTRAEQGLSRVRWREAFNILPVTYTKSSQITGVQRMRRVMLFEIGELSLYISADIRLEHSFSRRLKVVDELEIPTLTWTAKMDFLNRAFISLTRV